MDEVTLEKGIKLQEMINEIEFDLEYLERSNTIEFTKDQKYDKSYFMNSSDTMFEEVKQIIVLNLRNKLVKLKIELRQL